MQKQMKCKDCKWLDTSTRTSIGYLCRNQSRPRKVTAECSKYPGTHISDFKSPTTAACKYGFEPKNSEVAP